MLITEYVETQIPGELDLFLDLAGTLSRERHQIELDRGGAKFKEAVSRCIIIQIRHAYIPLEVVP